MDGSIVVSIVAGPSTMVDSWSTALSQQGLALGRNAPTVYELLTAPERATVALVDLRLADGTSPGDNIVALRQAGIEHVVVISGAEDRALIQQAARAGSCGLIRRTLDPSAVAAAVHRAALGREYVSADWVAAIDSDPLLAEVDLSVNEESLLMDIASGEPLESVAARHGQEPERLADAIGAVRRRLTQAAYALTTHHDTPHRDDAARGQKDIS